MSEQLLERRLRVIILIFITVNFLAIWLISFIRVYTLCPIPPVYEEAQSPEVIEDYRKFRECQSLKMPTFHMIEWSIKDTFSDVAYSFSQTVVLPLRLLFAYPKIIEQLGPVGTITNSLLLSLSVVPLIIFFRLTKVFSLNKRLFYSYLMSLLLWMSIHYWFFSHH